MTSETESYDDSPDDSSAWDRVQATRTEAAYRTIFSHLGKSFLDLARAYAKLGCDNTPKACALCLRSADAYQAAGLTRAGEVAWRWGRLLHRRRWRQEIPSDNSRAGRWATRPPSGRQLELAWAVDRLTRERGRPPTWRELADALGIGLAAVRHLARRCRDEGVVTFTDGKSRSIRATWRWPASGGQS